MDFALTDEQQMIMDTVRKIAEKEIASRAAELDEEGYFPEYALKVFAENGILNPLLPMEYGGVETSYLIFCMIVEEIAKVCASSSILLMAQADGMLPLLHGGSDELKEKYLGMMGGDSRTLTALGATEPGAVSDSGGPHGEHIGAGSGLGRSQRGEYPGIASQHPKILLFQLIAATLKDRQHAVGLGDEQQG